MTRIMDDNCYVVGSVFIDPKKAFDTVDHDLLAKNWSVMEFSRQRDLAFCLISITEGSTAELEGELIHQQGN